MAKWQSQILVSVTLLANLALPVMAQEAAFDSNPNSATAGTLGQAPRAQHNTQPISSCAGAENGSNLKNWSRFSQSASRPMFVRVPAGTKMPGQSASHYARPQCVAPGRAPQPQANQAGPVRRYLAYNVPAGHFVKKSQPAAAAIPARSVAAKKVAPAAVAVARKPATHIQVLGYGKGGQVTSSYMPISHKGHVAIACYPRYH